MSDGRIDRTGLERDFALVVAGFVLMLSAIVLVVGAVARPIVATKWGGTVAIVAVLELAYLFAHLESNHPEGASRQIYDSLGVANHVTLLRGGLFAATAGFVFLEPRGSIAWLPALLYGAGCVLDSIDGALARARDRMTLLGQRLDLAVDSLGFVVAPVVAIVWGRLPIWYLSLSAARYLFLAGTTWRRRRGRPVYDLPESAVRRPLAGLQMAFITFALAPVLPSETVHVLAVVVLPPSLIVFFRDYLVVAGHVGSG